MGVADHARCESRRIFPILYTSPVVSATTSNKNFQKIRYRAPYSLIQTDDRHIDGRTHEHSEIINIDTYRTPTSTTIIGGRYCEKTIKYMA